jgi:hypothetical protein
VKHWEGLHSGSGGNLSVTYDQPQLELSALLTDGSSQSVLFLSCDSPQPVPILGGSLPIAMSNTRLLKHVMSLALSPPLGRFIQAWVRPSAALCLVSRPELHIQPVDLLPNFPEVSFRG